MPASRGPKDRRRQPDDRRHGLSSKRASTWWSSRSAPGRCSTRTFSTCCSPSGARNSCPPAYRALAFADLEIPLPGGERMWAPKIEARVLQELKLSRGESVLEIGTGSGYLHRAAREPRRREVTSVEIDPELSAERRAHGSRATGLPTCACEIGDGARGLGRRAVRRHRADRIDAAPAGDVRRAAQARRTGVRGRRRPAGR